MNKTKTIIALLTLTCALTATVAPASGYFEAKVPGATKGPIAKLPTTSTLTIGGVQVTCTRNTKATGFWNIQTSEEQVITKGTKQQQQPGTKVGPHEAITITDWGSCVLVTGALAAKASPCRLQIAQTKGATIGHGSVQTDCVIEISAAVCTVTVEQQAANHELQTINLTNNESGQGVLIKANVTAISFKTAGAGCATAGLPAEGNNAVFKTGVEGAEAIETSLQKLI